MKQTIGYVALVVRDYDEAIDFYVNTLDFALVEDTPVPARKKSRTELWRSSGTSTVIYGIFWS